MSLRSLVIATASALFMCWLPVGHAQAPLLTSQPASVSVYPGQNAVFTALASSSLPFTYQWRVNDNNLPGQTNSTLDLTGVSPLQSGSVYTVVVVNGSGSVTSSPAILQVTPPAGSSPIYVWGNDSDSGFSNFSPINFRSKTGAVLPVYISDTNIGTVWGTDVYTDDSSLPAAAVHAGLLARGERGTVIIRIRPGQSSYVGSVRNGITSSSYGTWISSYEFVGLAPTVQQSPLDQARMIGGTARFEVLASGRGTLQYQWKFNDSLLSGETSSVLTFPVTSTSQAGAYSVTVTDDNSSVMVYAMLIVVPYGADTPQAPATSPSSMPIGSIQPMVITGNATAGALNGRGFYYAFSDLSRAAVHSGLLQNGETGVLPVLRLQDQPAFSGGLANGVSSQKRGQGPAFTFLGRAPLISKHPVSGLLLQGQSQRLSIELADASGATFQWRKDGAPIPGANQSTLAVDSPAPGTQSLYDVIVSLPGNPNLSETAMVIAPVANPKVFTSTDPAEAATHFGAAGNLVYLTFQTPTAVQGSLWGTGIYTTDSNLGLAAIHSGLATPGQKVQITIYTLGSWPSFISSTRNGITSLPYGRYPGMALGLPSVPVDRPSLSSAAPGQLLIYGAAQRACEVWASPTMQDGSWTRIDTILPTASPEAWSDKTSPFPAQRFYKVYLP